MKNKTRKYGLQDPKNRADMRALTATQMIEIKELISMGFKKGVIAKKYNISQPTLSRYLNDHVKPKP